MTTGKKGWKDLIASAPTSAEVLIVEDDPDLRRLTRTVIEGLGYSVKAAAMKCIDQGARTYLVKPLDADFLERAVRDALMVRELLVERNRLIRG